MFDREVKIADRIGRKDSEPEMAKPLHETFSGKVVVLVDAESASAAELFARIMQLEKRGLVMGDHSSGSVMEAREHSEQSGTDTAVYYGASVTEWNLIMADGKSLEHVGITPDEVVLPTAEDLANGRDPVLAHAAASLGVKISAEEAGKAFRMSGRQRSSANALLGCVFGGKDEVRGVPQLGWQCSAPAGGNHDVVAVGASQIHFA